MADPGGTSMGGPAREFPSTRWTVIRHARDRGSPEHRSALDELCRLYWKPIYAYVRKTRPRGNEEAKDLTQEFLLELLEGRLLSRFAPEQGSFRAYLRGALHLFLLERHREVSALKRGGGRPVVALDDADTGLIDALSVAPGGTPEEAFDRQWANTVIEHAVADLRDELARSGKEVTFRIFDRYELNRAPGDEPTYAGLAKEFGVAETDVHNHLTHCKRRLQQLIADRVRDYVGSEGEVTAELARLFAR